MFAANSLYESLLGAPPPLPKNIFSNASGLFDLPSYPFAPNPDLSVKINSPSSLRPNITAGDPSHLIVTSLWAPFSKLFKLFNALAAPLLPCQKIKSSACWILASASTKGVFFISLNSKNLIDLPILLYDLILCFPLLQVP